MQKLTYQADDGELVQKEYAIPPEFQRQSVSVDDGKEMVVLRIGSNSVQLTPDGARELAIALRQSANRISRILEDHPVEKSKARNRHK